MRARAADEIPLDFGAEESVRVRRRRHGMVERRTARAGVKALAAAIAEITEGAQDAAVRPLRAGDKARLARIDDLRRYGEDLATLASAMDVLQRRSA